MAGPGYLNQISLGLLRYTVQDTDTTKEINEVHSFMSTFLRTAYSLDIDIRESEPPIPDTLLVDPSRRKMRPRKSALPTILPDEYRMQHTRIPSHLILVIALLA